MITPDGGGARDEVTLRGMRFHVLVGILPHEREFPQPLEVDVTATVDPGQVVDYRGIYEAARDVMSAQPLDYLETIGDTIARRVLGLPGVRRARVAVRKPHVPLPGPLEYAEVVVYRDTGA